ncbi:MAG: 50S ribosomal protein L25 [Anaerovoracaceae bacterium]|jgi:large subunit ribosomal protein L25
MKEIGIIHVEKRNETNSRLSKKLRQGGLVPGNVSGKGMESIPVAVKMDELRKSIAKYGRNSVFKLDVDGEEHSIMIREIQYSPVKKDVLHVDFQAVSFTEEIKADIAVRVLGREQVELKRLILLQHLDTIPVKGLPQDIPEGIDVDVSELLAGDNFFVSDLKLPNGITPELDGEHLILSIGEAKTAAGSDEDEEATEDAEEQAADNE